MPNVLSPRDLVFKHDIGHKLYLHLELLVYHFNTLQICYRHMVDVHEELICRKNILTNLQHFQLIQFSTIVHID